MQLNDYYDELMVVADMPDLVEVPRYYLPSNWFSEFQTNVYDHKRAAQPMSALQYGSMIECPVEWDPGYVFPVTVEAEHVACFIAERLTPVPIGCMTRIYGPAWRHPGRPAERRERYVWYSAAVDWGGLLDG